MRDPATFDAFYSGSVRRVTGQLYAMTGSRTEAEDCVQEAYARAWQRWDKVAGHGDPEAWVRTVAYRVSVSAWRKAANMRTAHRRQWTPENARGLSPDYVAIIAALRKIPPRQRQAIVLHHLVGLSVEEIARETGAAPGTVKARLSRGRQAMAPYLADNEPGLGGKNAPGLSGKEVACDA
jgi:RNA polymerase sigma-70 factor (ECF subfamily)